MDKPSIALTELVEKGAKDDIVRELLAQIVARLMDFEIEQRTGAEYGERSGDRVNSRNGYAIVCGKLEPARFKCEYQSCVAARISPAFSNRGERLKKHSSR